MTMVGNHSLGVRHRPLVSKPEVMVSRISNLLSWRKEEILTFLVNSGWWDSDIKLQLYLDS